MRINRWWDEDPAERYWLETTDRTDLGVDLNAPQQDERSERWSYSLIREISEGDVIFHYHRPAGAIVAWSRAVGSAWVDEVVWAAHGTSARSRRVAPYRRPGWRLGLEGPFELTPPVTAADIEARASELRRIRADLEAKYSGTLYVPFEQSDRRPPRATQAYLTKFWAALVPVFPVLRAATPAASTPLVPSTPRGPIGAEYQHADEDAATGMRDPFAIDPAVVDRGLRGHAKTQNALAAHVKSKGLVPRSPLPLEPQFDLAWTDGPTTYVVEVKSLTRANEEQQLRLGLGQVLRYRQVLGTAGRSVRAVLAVEHPPTDRGWDELCADHNVILVWPGALSRI